LAAWAVTRLIVLAGFAVAAPHGVIGALGHWDGSWYGSISMHGYQFVADGKQHNVAFFPLFPMISSLLIRVGIAWPLAGVIVNNVAFLIAVLLLYAYVRQTFDVPTARWSAVVACAIPLSLFCSVAYSEGLFILFSVAALRCFGRKWFLAAGLAAAAAAATRPLGVALALGLIAGAIVERRKIGEILATSTGLIGIAAFAAYCQWRFNDPLAFVHAQLGWRHQTGFDLHGWIRLLAAAKAFSVHAWITIVFVVVAVPCVIAFRQRIGAAGVAYVIVALATIALAGTPFSVDRLLYATVPLLIALARLFTRAPFVGYVATAFSLPLLFIDAMTFAQFHWVA
jgi:hypothetical protein